MGKARNVRPRVDTPAADDQVIALKEFYRDQPGRWQARPKATIVVMSFNNAHLVHKLAKRLLAVEPDALIVCDDGSNDGSAERWREHLVGPNHYLIQSNDLHEIRAVSQAMGYLDTEYICVYQDDAIPSDDDWYARGLDIMDRWPGMGILGGWMTWGVFDKRRRYCMGDHTRAANMRVKSGIRPLAHKCPRTGHALEFCEVTPVGPLWIRTAMLKQTGGFNHELSAVGESGVHWDTDLCIRAWDSQWAVACYDGAMVQSRKGGTMRWGLDALKRNDQANTQRIIDRYSWSHDARGLNVNFHNGLL